MSAAASLDQWLERVAAGERLSADDLRALAATPDILQVGMLADAARHRRHGTRVTYLRLAAYPIDAVPSADTSLAKEIRLTGSPASLAAALAAVEAGPILAVVVRVPTRSAPWESRTSPECGWTCSGLMGSSARCSRG